MTETPRTWMLIGRGLGLYPVAMQGNGFDGECEVIEKVPVDAQRERMLGLLERILAAYADAVGDEHPDDINPELSAQMNEAEALLREHGRLPKEERC